ncbi:HAD-IA family hydrolase [Marinovum sp.]|uniref:HAD-IA family hydrolase n=1 Tax=Marinovum sp. TaxID=2024839 RepID=UPI002B272113|nr:HAD-IA family hydrolase [Marinovum sp.]
MSRLRLVIFDVDGTLVDSQGDIVAAMHAAFGALDLAPPAREHILGIVGLSLDVAMRQLAPQLNDAALDTLVAEYKDAYVGARKAGHSGPLYPGVTEVLDRLGQQDDWLLGIATGKSKRGLDALLEAQGLTGRFVTRQVSDFHPSKPHPAMLEAALAETGVDRADAVMVGDTSFDMDMARAAGIYAIGMSYGYHPVSALTSADVILDDMAALPQVLDDRWGQGA